MNKDDLILPLPYGSVTATTLSDMELMYKDGKSVEEISRHFGISYDRVSAMLGIKIEEPEKVKTPTITE